MAGRKGTVRLTGSGSTVYSLEQQEEARQHGMLPGRSGMATRQMQNFINGTWKAAQSGDRFESRNTAQSAHRSGVFPQSGTAEIEEAVHSANRAQESWRALGLVKRAEYLLRVARLMEEDTEPLAQIIAREAGKQVNEARADVVEAIHTAQYAFAFGHLGQYGRVLGDEVPSKRCYEILEPRGVVVAITPWNFPVALPFWLTGSYGVGLRIKQEVAKHANKVCTIETGGKNAVLVMEDANLDMAVTASLLSAFKTAGQRCVTAGRLLVDSRVVERFRDRFVETAKRVRVGDPLDDKVFYGAMINRQGVEKGRRFNEMARTEG